MPGGSMERGADGRAPSRGADLRRLAALAFTFLALVALPLAAAERAETPRQEPSVTGAQVWPNPILPGPVSVSVVASSETGNPPRYARMLIDDPLSPAYRIMTLVAPPADSPSEQFVWVGRYEDFGPGWHTLYIHASEDRVRWGSLSTFYVRAESPATYGPLAVTVTATPDVPRGAPMTVEATFSDLFAALPWTSVIAAAEFFVDTYAGDGAGIPLAGAYGTGTVDVSWNDTLILAPGTHTILVHARNANGTWGPLATASFVARSPIFTLAVEADRDTAPPGGTIAYTVRFANTGNANASAVSVDIALPPAVAYATSTEPFDTSDGSTYRWTFPAIGLGSYDFTVTATVIADVRDGASLAAEAALEYTNDQGWDFARVVAIASAAAIAPELAVELSGPAVAYAGETATMTLRIAHTGLRTIGSVDVTIEESADTEPLTGPRWQLTDVEPGESTVEIVERILPDAPDGSHLERAVRVEYTSRFGERISLSSVHALEVARPSLTLTVDADRQEVYGGERIAFHVAVENVGSIAPRDARLSMALAGGWSLVAGDVPTARSAREYAWTVDGLAAGTTRIQIMAEAREAGTYSLAFRLEYTSPNGVPLGTVEALVTVVVRSPGPLGNAIAVTATTGVVMLGGLLATERSKTALLFLTIPLYTRLQRAHILDHETRGMIRGYILANPGDHYNSIKGALELPNGTLAYHLQVLEKEFLVKSVKDGKFRRFYPFDMRMPEGGEPTRIQKVVVDLVRANPGITPRDAASLLGLTSSTVSYHLERLAELRLVEFRREGISKRLYVPGDLGF